jgi:8-oxo-dGTP pyrophosphatase MutT (NUDIX family)
VTSGQFPVNPRPAATVVVLRDSARGPEAFMVRRHEGTAFMGGAHVFPGGRVDDRDHDADVGWCDGIDHAAAQLPGIERTLAIAFHVAAARELFEEAGVLLARDERGGIASLTDPGMHARFAASRHEVHDGRQSLRGVLERERLRLSLDALVLLAHWVTPPVDTRQFDTRFFITRVPPNQVPAHDETETTHSSWLTPAAAIAQAQRGEIILPPPTWTTLRELEHFATVADALQWARSRRISRRQPKMLEEGGRRMLVLPGDPRYPEATDAEQPVETCFVLVDKRWRAEPPRT